MKGVEIQQYIVKLVENCWKANKDRIDGCIECELRYACSVPAIMNACTCNPMEGR